jgi:hypothetical protein
MFTTNFTVSDKPPKAQNPLINDQLSSIKLMPVAKNVIIIRLENLSEDDRAIDLAVYASNLYEVENNGNGP